MLIVAPFPDSTILEFQPLSMYWEPALCQPLISLPQKPYKKRARTTIPEPACSAPLYLSYSQPCDCSDYFSCCADQILAETTYERKTFILTCGFSQEGASPSFRWKDVAAGTAQLASVGVCGRVAMAARPRSRKQGALVRTRTE